MAWKSFEVPKLPASLTAAATSLTSLTGTLTGVLKILQEVLTLISQLELLTLDITQTLIQTAIAAIESAIQALLSDTGAYLLLVPVRRKVVIPPIVTAALSKVGLPSIPPVNISTDLIAVQTDVPVPVFSASGGNLGFQRTVVESLLDAGDANRPVLEPSDAVTGFYIVAGATDYGSMLSFMDGITAFMAQNRPATALDSPGLPIPQNVKSKLVASKTTADLQAFIEWKFQEPLTQIPSFNLTCLVTQYAVIRSTDMRILTATTVQELFGTGTLTKGLSTGSGPAVIEVLDVIDYRGVNIITSYFDTAVSKGIVYYYALAYNMKVGGITDIASGGGTETGFRKISKVTKLYYPTKTRVPRSISGNPPDWIRTPRAIDLVPPLGSLIDTFIRTLTQFGSFTTGASSMLKDYISFIGQEIQNFETLTARVTDAINRLQSLTKISTEGLGVHFRSYSGVGGTPFLLQDLTAAMSAGNPDAQRPKYDLGTEFVCGVVVLAAAPSPALLAPVQLVLDTLFGGGSSSNPITNAIAGIDVALRAAETAAFGPAFNATITTTTAPALTTVTVAQPLIGADDDGTKDLNCPPAVSADITFSDDLSPA